jgi:hypothetical protein
VGSYKKLCMKLCPRCGIHKERFPLSNRTITKHGGVKVHLKTKCMDCHSRQQRIRKELHKIYEQPDPNTPCECCGRMGELILDHDHTTGAFRGWLCRECNSGLGFLGDDVAGITAALLYLTS